MRRKLISGCLVILVFLTSCKEDKPKAPVREPSEQPEISTEPTAEPTPSPDIEESTPEPLEQPPAEIRPEPLQVTWQAIPPALEVLQENEVELVVRIPGSEEARCSWRFPGTPEALEGCSLTRRFEEPSADVEFTLEVRVGERLQVLNGRLPLERLPVEDEQAAGEPPEKKNNEKKNNAPVRRRKVAGLQWSLQPPELGVMRDTLVRMEAIPEPTLGDDVICRWTPGDDSEPLTGCSVEHLFRGGLTDRIVTLELLKGDEVLLKETSLLPYERLPTTPSKTTTEEADDPVPGCTSDCRRIAVANVSGEGGLKAAEHLARSHHASLLVLFLRGKAIEPAHLKRLSTRLEQSSIDLLPIPCVRGPLEAAVAALLQTSAPTGGLVPHTHPSELPFRYAAKWQNTFLIAAAMVGSTGIDDEEWMAHQLKTGSVFPSRLLFTCKSLDRLTGQETDLIPSPYRVYEKWLRGNLSLLVAAGSPVFYRGMYGILKTLSPGLLGGSPGALLGSNEAQPPSGAVIDLSGGRVMRCLGVLAGETSWSPFPDAALPKKVGVFIRW